MPFSIENTNPLDAIAVIGFSIRFPQDATCEEALWDIMIQKKNTATTFPVERMAISSIYHPDPNRRGQVSLLFEYFHTKG